MTQQKQRLGTIKITQFALRHFEPDFGGTKILNVQPQDFEQHLNIFKDLYFDQPEDRMIDDKSGIVRVDILDGYAPFCKLLVMKNITDCKTGTLPITIENYQYLRSGYSARREGEFSVFSQWLELPVKHLIPRAEYTVSILYDKAQIDKELKIDYEKEIASGGIDSIGLEPPAPFDADWGVVAILGQMQPKEEPMKPITMMRNYMDLSMGGSGMKLPVPPVKPNSPDISELTIEYNKAVVIYNQEMKEINEKYQKCVDFWSKNVTVK